MIYLCVCEYICIPVSVCMYVCMYVCMRVHVCSCVCTGAIACVSLRYGNSILANKESWIMAIYIKCQSLLAVRSVGQSTNYILPTSCSAQK